MPDYSVHLDRLIEEARFANTRHREALKSQGVEVLGDMIRADRERKLRDTFGTSEAHLAAERRRLQAEADQTRRHELALRTALGDELTAAEAAELAALGGIVNSRGDDE